MRKFAVLIALAGISCGPMGNTLGLDGTYKGNLATKGEGTVTTYQAGGSTVYDSKLDEERSSSFTVEPGYTSDAVVTGGSCPASLMVSGNKLMLKGETKCDDTQEITTTQGADSSVQKDYAYITYTKFDVEKIADGKIRVTIEANNKNEKYLDSDKTQDVNMDVELSFEGDRIADE